MIASLRILMVHQGAELYGSDRSFAATVQAVRTAFPYAIIDVCLPEDGPLTDLLRADVDQFIFEPRGILRKVELKRRPWKTLWELMAAVLSYRKRVKQYDICYVNTVVCVSAIVALRRCPASKAIVHLREIPGGLARRVFVKMLAYSKATLVYNSAATAGAFGLAGEVVHNGVEGLQNVETERNARNWPLRILIIGRINTWKGQQFVVDALRTHGRSVPIEMRIVGDVFKGYEPLLETLRASAAECAQPVTISGFVEDPSAHFAWADFILVPSVQPEPFGRVAIESFSAGRPVLASRGGGLSEIVEDGFTGWLFEPGNVRQLLHVISLAVWIGPAAYRDMSFAARRVFTQRFTHARYSDAMAAIFRRAVARPTLTLVAGSGKRSPKAG